MSIAAADPSCGAGLQADLLSIARLGCHPVTVLTAYTCQDTTGVAAVWPIDADRVMRQAQCAAADMPVAAIKIGLLGTTAIASRVALLLREFPGVPVVLDPVLASGRGDALADADLASSILELLVPLATVVTPNVMELRRLTASTIDEMRSLADCARRLVEAGADFVLATGTHDDTVDVVNTLYGPGQFVEAVSWPRLPGSYHGSGCTLASAVAAFLARGEAMSDAARHAQEYTWQTLRNAYRPGAGQFIPDRLCEWPDVYGHD
jgi:hydroxymethylpyrimidine/phosphomethylpyrimidine kinase